MGPPDLANMHLLIYGLNNAPVLTGTGKYTGEMAMWLAARGHGVEVLDAWRVTSLCGKWHNRLTYILL